VDSVAIAQRGRVLAEGRADSMRTWAKIKEAVVPVGRDWYDRFVLGFISGALVLLGLGMVVQPLWAP